MSLIVLEHATLQFGPRTIFADLTLTLGENDRVGLIGPNGSGKSTLLKIISGLDDLDSGTIRRPKGCRIAYLPQDVLELRGETLLLSVLATVPGRDVIANRVTEVETQLMESADPDEQMALAMQLADLSDQLEHFETYYTEFRAVQILKGLGFKQKDLTRPTSEFSGGWKMRGALAGLLFQNPEVLLLDEPTNHLDLPTVVWFKQFLRDYHGALVLICHDRDFINQQIDRVWSFEPEGVRVYKGNYDNYLEQRALELEVIEARARNREREVRDLQRFVDRFKAKASKARQAQSRAKQIERMQKEMDQERPVAPRRELRFSFPPTKRSGKEVVLLENVAKSYGSLELYRNITRGVYAGDRIAIVGVNGAGKTTILKIIAGELAPDRGTVRYGANVELSYYAQHHAELLNPKDSILQHVSRIVPEQNETTVRGICGSFLFSGDDVDKSIGVLSGGERARVVLASILVKPGNFLLMDEPTNHLDIAAAEALANALEDYTGTLVFVSHNSAFINRLATKIWEIDDKELVEHPGNLDDYLEYLQRKEARAALASSDSSNATPSQKSHPSSSNNRPPQKNDSKERETQQRKKKSQQQKLTTLEQQLETLEGERSALELRLADPSLYRDKQAYHQSLERFQELQSTIETTYRRWEETAKELESLSDA